DRPPARRLQILRRGDGLRPRQRRDRVPGERPVAEQDSGRSGAGPRGARRWRRRHRVPESVSRRGALGSGAEGAGPLPLVRQPAARQVPDREVRPGGLLMRPPWPLLAAVLALPLVAACSPKKLLAPDVPPQTTMFVQFDDTNGTPHAVNHRVHLYWFGADPD